MFFFIGDCNRFAKLLSCSVAETRSQIISREKNDLLNLLAVEGDEPEAVFIQEALKSKFLLTNSILSSNFFII